MGRRKIDLRDFLADLRCGSSAQHLMAKYNLDAIMIEGICRKLNRPDLTAALELWESGKLTEAEFSRAFSEVQACFDGDE
ncbi:MAG: hypothetical protein HY913_06735 [Desulfomonile tiedjei]|nr:hypothetical protein [Desulfomonile tiedjei]